MKIPNRLKVKTEFTWNNNKLPTTMLFQRERERVDYLLCITISSKSMLSHANYYYPLNWIQNSWKTFVNQTTDQLSRLSQWPFMTILSQFRPLFDSFINFIHVHSESYNSTINKSQLNYRWPMNNGP